MSLHEGWVESTLGEVINIQSGKTRPKLKGKYPVYGGNGILNYANKYNHEMPTIIVGRVGAYCGNVFIEEEKFWLSDNALGITSKNENDLQFIFYKLQNMKLNNYSIGGAQPLLTQTLLNELDIRIPQAPVEQKAIANILSSFDEKIELLKAQNETLEQMAQGVFREWFVKFNYPNVTGKMVESELGVIPEGWRVDTIDNLVELIIDYRGKTPKKLGMDWSEKGIPALSAKTIKNGKIVRRDAMNLGSEELYHLWMKDELMPKDILLTSEAPLGEMYYLIDDKKYILSQRLFALRANDKISSEYLYYYLFSRQGQNLLNARASGSTVQGIRQSELRKVEVLIPDSKTLEKASALFERVFQKINLNENQIQTLQKTRDTLLPKLMSGDVRVKGFGA